MVVGNAVKHVIKSQVFLVIFQSIFFCLVASFHALHARFVGPTESTTIILMFHHDRVHQQFSCCDVIKCF